ncbi:FOG: TPR repeat [uncultured Candidatus Thioglobus sp.]|nr:FOG: TPR repeat [uncultured Candidatus Thioglobus sp.]
MAKNKIPSLSFKFSDLFTADYRLITALLIALPLLIYAQVWNFEFVWDDNHGKKLGVGHIFNPFVQEQTWANFIQLFSEPYYRMFIPITYFFWGLLKAFSEFLSLPFNSVLHLTNVAVHIINGLLVFTILKQFVREKWALLIGVLLFLLHPIQVEVTAWVGEFRTLLAFAFSLSALYIYLKNQANFSYLSLLLFVLALLSKPSAVVLVLFIFAFNYFHYGLKLVENIKKTLPFALIALVFVVITSSVQPISASHIIAVWQRPFVWLDSTIFYLFKIIFPFNLGASYALSPKFISSQWWFYPLAFLPLGLGYFVWLKRKTQPLLIFAIVLFMAGFFTTSGFVSFNFQQHSVVADRYLYFSMFGTALLIAVIFSKTNKKLWQGLIISILLVFVALSAFRQIPIWHNGITLWQHSKNFEVRPTYAHSNLAAQLYNKGLVMRQNEKHQQAIDYFTKAILYYPKAAKDNLSGALFNRGLSLLHQKKYRQALTDFDQLVQIQPQSQDAHDAKIHVLVLLKQCDKAYKAVSFAGKNKVKPQANVLANIKKTCPK